VQDKLASIFAELEAGQPFEDVARKYSESATASEGGEFSSKLDPNDLSESFRTAIEPLSPGEYTPAIETSIGYQIFYVQEINKESDVPLDSVYKEIEEELYNQQYQEKMQAWVEELRENAHIKILQ
jgi:parvulin-like peptidyl-prolyl isomerase